MKKVINYDVIMKKGTDLRNEAMRLFEQEMNDELILDKDSCKHILEQLASNLDKLFYEYHLDLVGIWNRWHSETGFGVHEVNGESICRKHMLDVVKTVTRKQKHYLFYDKVYRIFDEFEYILKDIIEEFEKEDVKEEFEITVEEASVAEVYVDDNFNKIVCVEVIGIDENGDRHEIFTTMDELIDIGVKEELNAGDKLRYRYHYNTEECELLDYKPEKSPIDRLNDLIEQYKEEASKDGIDDLLEENERYADTDSFKEEIDDTEREILRQGKLPFEDTYDGDDKYYLISHPMTVARAYVYGADYIAKYEIRKTKVTFAEMTLGYNDIYKGSYDECVREFHEHAEFISEMLDPLKIHFQCIGSKTFKGRG